MSALLDAATGRPLTVVVAPAGYGRTTALQAWCAAAPEARSWLTLDRGDDDPRRLWARLLAALEGPVPDAAGAPTRALGDGDDLLDVVLPATVRAVEGAQAPRAILVLDDAHHVRSPSSWRALGALADALPAGLGLVVSSRTPPPLRLSGRRAAGTLATLGPDDLEFDPGEAAALVAAVERPSAAGAGGRRRTALDPAARDRRARVAGEVAGGWAAGLAIAAEVLARAPGRRTAAEARADAEDGLDAYVAEEIVDRADPHLRRFLLRSAVLDRLTGPLCAAVLDDPAAPTRLERAVEAGLLVDVPGGTLRHRGTLRGALLRLLRLRDPDLVGVLHARASRALADDGRLGAAVLHAQDAGDRGRAVALTDGHLRAVGARPGGARPPVGGAWPWTGDPRDAVRSGREDAAATGAVAPAVRAAAAATLGQALWLVGDPDGARALLEPQVGGMDHPAPRCWSLAVLALAVGDDDAERAERLARQARRIARRAEATWLERVLAHQALADALRRRGDHDEARAALDRAAACTAEVDDSAHHVLTLVLRSELAAATGDGRAAHRAAADARGRLAAHPGQRVLRERSAARA